MPTINKVSFATLRTLSFQGNQQQNISMPTITDQGLKKDTISFNGLFSNKPPVNKYFINQVFEIATPDK